MRKVKSRSLSIYILVAVAILGMGFYVGRYIVFGSQWASAPFNQTVFQRGILNIGVVADRNGVILADVTDGRRTFASSADVRRSTLHAVGDLEGNVGTGALSAFASDLAGYNLITGSFSLSSSGSRVDLTIDSELNRIAHRALDGRRGVVMVSNYKTGEILCMVSNPTFDPANPPGNVNTPALEGVYVNRAIQSAYTPGSTFKLVTAAAALENIRHVHDLEFTCTGELITARGTITCPGEHGTIGIDRGMAVSCNVVYGQLAIDLGGGIMAEYAEKLGLSGRTTVSGMQTVSGNFDEAAPDSADLAWSGVGQFTNMVNPATMLRFVGAIANDGIAVELHYKQRSWIASLFPPRSTRILNRNTAGELGLIMELQNRASFPNLEIHAKSGTAQVGGGNDPHAWYVGYITNENYPLAFVVIVENGGSGTGVAAPIANRVLQAAVGG